MGISRRILWLAAVLALTGFSCSREVIHRYEYMPGFTIDAIPQKVYVEDQVNVLNTGGALPAGGTVFVEVRRKDGVQERGMLKQVTYGDLIMSRGYKYAVPDDTTKVIEDEISIPKKHILILKVW
jgi:hypothetical protein